MKSLSYPNFNYYMSMKPARDVNKWVQSARELYFQLHKGANRQQALAKITENWDEMEKLDFNNWLRYYEQGTPGKYKQAQLAYWGDQNNLGYYLPMPQESKPTMTTPAADLKNIQNPATHPDVMQEEKRQIVEKIRGKIVGRIDSAEKILRSEEGQTFAGPEFAELMEAIHQLKKKIYLVNKISTSVRLYQDMIIREANVLNARGHRGASNFLMKIAQEVPSAAEAPNPIPIGEGQAGSVPGQTVGQVPPDNTPPGNISVDMSQQGAPPETAPTNTPPPPTAPAAPSEPPLSEGMKQFLENLDTANVDKDLEVNEADSDFVVEAQTADPAGLPPEPVMEVEEPAPVATEEPAAIDFDAKLDQTFANLTVADVVSKLEDLSKIFKTREIPRQLAIVDMQLDHLGLASFFPELSEATNKALESTMYIGTRVEDMLARLRGTLTTKDIDLAGENDVPPPGAEPVKQQLQQEEAKDKARKQMRKQLEEAKLNEANKPAAPAVEMQQDLSQPATVEPAPAAPPVPPAPAV